MTGELPVEIERHGAGVATVVLNRPQKFNALSIDLMTALEDALRAIDEDRTVRVVVLAARGRAFCAGHDLQEMRANPGRQALERIFGQCSRLMLTITRLRQPVIARVHGVATAAGCQLVASCDLAVATVSARFAVSGVNLGLFCSTPMVALSRSIAPKRAMEMLLTGEFIDAVTAEQWGLVNRVVPVEALDEAVGALAARIAAKSPAAIALGKQLFARQCGVDLDSAYGLATETMVCNMLTEDAQAGIDSFIAKQPPPAWQGR
jgi:enoyl-CoA hydratase/carnithine racemase